MSAQAVEGFCGGSRGNVNTHGDSSEKVKHLLPVSRPKITFWSVISGTVTCTQKLQITRDLKSPASCSEPLWLLRPSWWIHTVWFSKHRQTGSLQTSEHWAHNQASTQRLHLAQMWVCSYANDDASAFSSVSNLLFSVFIRFSLVCIHSLSLPLPPVIFGLSVFAQTSTIHYCMIALNITWECVCVCVFVCVWV